MLKSDLRRQGFSVTDYYPKRWKINLIWAVLMMIMIAIPFFLKGIIDRIGLEYSADKSISGYILDFFNDTIATTINSFLGYVGATSIIYLVIWAGIFAAVCYIIKNNSDEQNKHERKKWKTIAIRLILVVLILAAIFIFMAEIAYYYNNHEKPPPAFEFFERLNELLAAFFSIIIGSGGGALVGIVFYLVFFMFMYLALKLIMTIFVCSNKFSSIKLKFLKHNAMPVCHCKEAMTVKQAFLINFMPAICIYSMLLIMAIRSPNLFLVIFMTFFASFDLTAAVYILFYKIKLKTGFYCSR